ncbi:hypothetical protein SAMN02745165_01357 [Malonomonas rubra DSM 5091]|uniref:Phage integrase family protein n=1 Tax=Malonomonas rubra DSM 5091 TaxID=1122189 RepID=A0A1M6FNW3_MALRU|nr:site-specific integrase [Malonomonas rubra]SHI99401.1 hypothetical protein SAMN02745165_01357 [Malonomonas rubra DSM 5091]
MADIDGNNSFKFSVLKYVERSAPAERLCAFLSYHGVLVNGSDLNRLLSICNAPLALDRLFLVLSAAPDVFELAISIAESVNKPSLTEDFEQCKPLLALLLSHRDLISNDSPEFEKTPLTSSNETLKSLSGKSSLYSTLGFLPFENDRIEKYNHLKAQSLIASLVLGHSYAKSIPQVRKALVTVRALVYPEYDHVFEKLPSNPCPPNVYIRALEKFHSESRVRELIPFFEKAFSKIRSLPELPVLKDNTTAQSPMQEPEILTAFRINHPEEEPEIEELSEIGVELVQQNSSEAGPDFDALFFVESESCPFNAGQASKKISRDNQLFSFAWQELSNADISFLLDEITPNGLLDHPIDDDSEELLLAKASLQLMFWVGFSYADLSEIRLWPIGSPPKMPCYLYPEGILRIPSKGAELSKPKSSYQSSYRVANQEYIDLILPQDAVTSISHVCQIYYPQHVLQSLRAGSQPSIGTEKILELNLFPCDLNKIEKAVNRQLSQWHKNGFYRLTAFRIRNFHPRKLARMPFSDITTSDLTLGRSSHLGQTKIHYASFKSIRLAYMFNRSCKEILAESGRPDSSHCQVAATNSFNLGTPFRLQQTTIIHTARSLRTAVDAVRKNATTVSGIVVFHNLFTAYTALLVSYAIGHRRSGLPFLATAAWDEKTGFACCRDKDTDDFYHTRLLWLPEACQEQLINYRNHLRVLNIPVAPDNVDKDKEFFFIRQDFTVDTTLETLHDILCNHGYDFSGHPQRHFLKSVLQERGCSPTVVELFLGHWNLGLEGWVKTSALHPADYRDELKKNLPELLEGLELSPLEGLRRKAPRLKIPLAFPVISPPPPSNSFPTERPALFWFDVLGKKQKGCLDIEDFQPHQKVALEILYKYWPEAYTGDTSVPSITDSDFDKLLRSLQNRSSSIGGWHKSYNFLRKGLQYGSKKHGWSITIPPRFKELKKHKNLIRPDVFQSLKQCRELEGAFLDSLKDPLPKRKIECVGQILLSAILYGGFLHKDWVAAFVDALFRLEKNSQHGDWLWLNLWNGKIPDSEKESDVFQAQSDPARFRRWIADPLTQLLIYRWRRERPGQSNKSIRGEPIKILNEVFKILEKERGKGASKRKILSYKIKTISQLLKIASSRYTISLPPFLVEYAMNRLPSCSLPDQIWRRSFTEETQSISYSRRHSFAEERIPVFRSYDEEIQLEHLDQIQEKILEKKPDNTEYSKNEIREKINKYLSDHVGSISPVLKLLGEWAVQLLDKQESKREHRKKSSPLEGTTVNKYLAGISEELISECQFQDPLNFDQELYLSLYKKVAKALKDKKGQKGQKGQKSTKNPEGTYRDKVTCLHQFHGFLVTRYHQPDINLLAFIDKKKRPSQQISANLITEAQHRRILKQLGWDSEDLTRYQRMRLVVTILAYRTGLRINEIYGLLMEDLQIGPTMTDLLVFPNNYRGLKSTSAIRREPLNIMMPEKELSFVKKWVAIRRAEPSPMRKAPVFTDSPLSKRLASDRILIQPLRDALKLILDDRSVVIHHQRDSFAHNHLLKLTLRSDIRLHQHPAFIDSDHFTKRQRDLYTRQLFPNDEPGTKKLFSAAVLLGHADVDEGFLSYFHLTDWLLGYHLRHPDFLPQISTRILEQITGLGNAYCQEIANDRFVLQKLIQSQAGKNEDLNFEKERSRLLSLDDQKTTDKAEKSDADSNQQENEQGDQQPAAPLEATTEATESKNDEPSKDTELASRKLMLEFDALISHVLLSPDNELTRGFAAEIRGFKKREEEYNLAKAFYRYVQDEPPKCQKRRFKTAELIKGNFIGRDKQLKVSQSQDLAQILDFLDAIGIHRQGYKVIRHTPSENNGTGTSTDREPNHSLACSPQDAANQLQLENFPVRISFSKYYVSHRQHPVKVAEALSLCCQMICIRPHLP